MRYGQTTDEIARELRNINLVVGALVAKLDPLKGDDDVDNMFWMAKIDEYQAEADRLQRTLSVRFFGRREG